MRPIFAVIPDNIGGFGRSPLRLSSPSGFQPSIFATTGSSISSPDGSSHYVPRFSPSMPCAWGGPCGHGILSLFKEIRIAKGYETPLLPLRHTIPLCRPPASPPHDRLDPRLVFCQRRDRDAPQAPQQFEGAPPPAVRERQTARCDGGAHRGGEPPHRGRRESERGGEQAIHGRSRGATRAFPPGGGPPHP